MFCIVFLVNPIEADNWLKWRGPSGNGKSTENGWNPNGLKNGANIKWKIKIGSGYSSVSVRDNFLYTMGNSNNEDVVYCLNVKTGKEVYGNSLPSWKLMKKVLRIYQVPKSLILTVELDAGLLLF